MILESSKIIVLEDSSKCPNKNIYLGIHNVFFFKKPADFSHNVKQVFKYLTDMLPSHYANTSHDYTVGINPGTSSGSNCQVTICSTAFSQTRL